MAAERAEKTEKERAAATAEVAEVARIAAEKAKQMEQAKAQAAERARAEAERVAAQKAAAEKAAADKAAAEKLAAEKAAVDKAALEAAAKDAADKKAKEEKLAALSPAEKADTSAIDLTRALQAELRRVGCNTRAVDGNWSSTSQKALDLFDKHAGMKLDVTAASSDALDAVKSKTGRICPLICQTGYRADGDKCVKITCRAGYKLNDDGTCEKIEVKKPTAKREESNGASMQLLEYRKARPRRQRRASRFQMAKAVDVPGLRF